MWIHSAFVRPVSLAAFFALLVAAAPVTSQSTATGDPTDASAGQDQNPNDAALEGSDAYAALLDRYIQEHPDAARHPEFLPYFAGLGCRAERWHGKRRLDPFQLSEIESAAQSRLDRKLAEAGASAAAEPTLITFRANLTAGDYDMAENVFPLTPGGSMEVNLRPDDFCQSVARTRDLHQRSVFPAEFRIVAADGAAIEPSHVVQLLGGQVAVGREQARAFYDRGFPTIVAEVTGRVRSVARAKTGVAFITLEPVQATLRSQGNAQHAQELAVLGPEQMGSLAAGAMSKAAASGGSEALMHFDRDVYLFKPAHRPRLPLAVVSYSTKNLDASEAKALTGAITGALSAEPRFIESHGEAASIANFVNSRHQHALVAGNWRSKLAQAIELHYPNADFSVIQIARAAEAAATDGASND